MEFALWTRAAVGQLIEREFKIALSVRGVGKYLKRWGFTPQKPIRRAYERSPEAVKAWLDGGMTLKLSPSLSIVWTAAAVIGVNRTGRGSGGKLGNPARSREVAAVSSSWRASPHKRPCGRSERRARPRKFPVRFPPGLPCPCGAVWVWPKPPCGGRVSPLRSRPLPLRPFANAAFAAPAWRARPLGSRRRTRAFAARRSAFQPQRRWRRSHGDGQPLPVTTASSCISHSAVVPGSTSAGAASRNTSNNCRPALVGSTHLPSAASRVCCFRPLMISARVAGGANALRLF